MGTKKLNYKMLTNEVYIFREVWGFKPLHLHDMSSRKMLTVTMNAKS